MADQDMTDQDKDKRLDDLLESLLSTYSVAEPRPGLETRILAQVRSAAGEKRSWFWKWSWLGAGAAAIAAILLVVYFSRPTAQRHPAPLVSVKPLPQSHPPKMVERPALTIKVPDRGQQPRHVAPEETDTLAARDRPAVFPTPVALSDQEKLFLRYLAGTPRDEVIAQSHSDEVVDGLPEDQSALPAIFPARQSATSGTR
jgi:hypothetical protein